MLKERRSLNVQFIKNKWCLEISKLKQLLSVGLQICCFLIPFYNNGVKCILKVEENTTVSILMNK